MTNITLTESRDGKITASDEEAVLKVLTEAKVVGTYEDFNDFARSMKELNEDK